jgi:NADH-quinone oxidoreductase subunit N
MMIALLSLAGIPPMAGFVGKVYLFYAAMEKGYLWLVIAGALNSTVSLYYYMLVLKRMYIWDKKKELPKVTVPLTVKIVLILTEIGMLLLGIFPGPVVDITTDISQKLFM